MSTTTADVLEILKYHLSNFNKKGVEITENTQPRHILSESDGFGSANSKNLFRGSVRWTFKHNRLKDKPWPKDWFTLPIAVLAEKLLIFLLLLLPLLGSAQLKVSVGAARTDLGKNALALAVTYLRNLDSSWQNQDYLLAGKRSFFMLTPEATIETGTQDAFSSIIIKASGLLATFKTTTVGGLETPNTAKVFQTFPMSISGETDNLFNYVNWIAEVGWSPWYQNATKSAFLKATKFGVFLQAGYKIKLRDTLGTEGGQAEGSKELTDQAILRAKGSAAIESGAIIHVQGFNIGVAGSGDVWLDIRNGAVYHRIDAKARVYLPADNFIDLGYQHGSGAPNFNQGDQFGIGLTITF